jgi:hypothetical protein
MLLRQPPKGRQRRERDPERTRKLLRQAPFREVNKSGFQSTGLVTILATNGVTKGALTIISKQEGLGYAKVEAVVAASMRDK